MITIEKNPQLFSVDDLVTRYETDVHKGLTSAETEEREKTFGKNMISEGKKKSLLNMFLSQFKDILILILIAAAVISGFLGELSDTVLILIIVIINAIVGVVQEYRAENAMAALKQLTVNKITVFRDGGQQLISSEALVPGDIVILNAGDCVPADGRLIESASLKIQESALTGESVPVEKDKDCVCDADAPLGDRKNCVYSGSMVIFGHGLYMVTSIGMETELGKIAAMLDHAEEKETPLQKNLAEVGKIISIAVVGICIVMCVIGALMGQPLMQMFMTAVSLAVAAIPEGLPAIVTVVLAMGTKTLVEHHAIVKKLPSVETLGCASVICSDKTGTLTQNKMTIKKIYADGVINDADKILEDGYSDNERMVVEIGLLCNDAVINDNGEEIGDPTEVAMIAYANFLDYDKREAEKKYPRVGELPFDSDRKLMTTLHRNAEIWCSYTKGAPDVLLEKCRYYLLGSEVMPLTDEFKRSVLEEQKNLSGQAYRVLGYAYQKYDRQPSVDPGLEEDLIFVGLTGMIDPPREEVKDSVRECHEAGIKTVMITGDHKITATAIGKALGICSEGDLALSGAELEQMSDEELDEKIEKTSIYARVSPEHKVRIVKAWQRKDAVVAMTGDGVNDAPALKNADIGCAMGITGTDVTKESADMILTDDNFSTIVSAVKEGRNIFENIKKAIHFLLSTNIAEILIIFVSIVFGWPTPLLPIQILWVNLVTDSLPALALGMEHKSDNLMQSKPRGLKQNIFSNGFGSLIIVHGIVIAVTFIALFYYGFANIGLSTAQTMVFMALCFSELTFVLSVRSERGAAFNKNFFTNRYLWGSLILSMILQLTVIGVPFLRNIFGLSSLNIQQWIITIAVSFIPFAVSECLKPFLKNNPKKV